MEFTRQLEYEIRLACSQHIKDKVKKYLDDFFYNNSSKIGFLIHYPLLLLETLFDKAFPDYYKINIDRKIISWFIKEMKKRNFDNNSNKFTFNELDFNKFKEQYIQIKKAYKDLQYSKQLLDMFSISRIAFEKEDQNIIFKKPSLSDKYPDVPVYYLGLDDEERFEEEQKYVNAVIQHLHKYYPYFKKINVHPFIYPEKKHLNNLKNLISNFDIHLLHLCIDRVKQDTKKIGEVESPVIKDFEELNKVLGVLYYIGQVTYYRYKAFEAHHKFKIEDMLISFDKDWLIRKICQVTNVDSNVVENYINYLSLGTDNKGSLLEFPLIEHQEKILFIPSSIVLNDWHFSLVNGHYFKNLQFTNRDDTISASIIKNLIKKVKNYSNIEFVYEKYYEFELNGKKENSDIDFAMYDIEANKLLVIECKWKDNVYLPEENFEKITRAINEIYKNQLDKHKTFFEMDKSNIDYIFDFHPEIVRQSNEVDITYVALDKRAQIHLNDKHMLPVYTFMYLLDNYSDGQKLYLNDLIMEIKSLRTNITYDTNTVKACINKEVAGLSYKIELFGLNLDY